MNQIQTFYVPCFIDFFLRHHFRHTWISALMFESRKFNLSRLFFPGIHFNGCRIALCERSSGRTWSFHPWQRWASCRYGFSDKFSVHYWKGECSLVIIDLCCFCTALSCFICAHIFSFIISAELVYMHILLFMPDTTTTVHRYYINLQLISNFNAHTQKALIDFSKDISKI